jgi:hypothetical protein
MRFERKGGPPDLEAAFTNLIVTQLRGRALDDNRILEAAEGQFPDFSCFRGILLVEMKHLESDQQERINEVGHEADARVSERNRPILSGLGRPGWDEVWSHRRRRVDESKLQLRFGKLQGETR